MLNTLIHWVVTPFIRHWSKFMQARPLVIPFRFVLYIIVCIQSESNSYPPDPIIIPFFNSMHDILLKSTLDLNTTSTDYERWCCGRFWSFQHVSCAWMHALNTLTKFKIKRITTFPSSRPLANDDDDGEQPFDVYWNATFHSKCYLA